MEKRRKTQKRALDRGILVRELAAFERRLDARLDSRLEIQTEVLKAYVNGRFTLIDARFDKLERKFDVNTAGLVEMIERGFGEVLGIRSQVDNHETRITTLESKSIS